MKKYFLMLTVLALSCGIYAQYKPTPKQPPVRDAKPAKPTPPTSKNLNFSVNGVKFEMIFVEGGIFTMGCTAEQGGMCPDKEMPVHQVSLSSFYMGKYEVTQELWYAVMGTSIHQQREKSDYAFELSGTGNEYPVYYINYHDCEEFCGKLNKLLGNQLPDGYKFGIPTEAQWEYAARGGKHSKNYKFSGSDYSGEVAWYSGNSNGTHEVGTKDKNELGIYDMSGNVWEWCYDWYSDSYYSNSSSDNPKGAGSGSFRVLRGGSCIDYEQDCRVSDRHYDFPDFRGRCYGFRLALVP